MKRKRNYNTMIKETEAIKNGKHDLQKENKEGILKTMI